MKRFNESFSVMGYDGTDMPQRITPDERTYNRFSNRISRDFAVTWLRNVKREVHDFLNILSRKFEIGFRDITSESDLMSPRLVTHVDYADNGEVHSLLFIAEPLFEGGRGDFKTLYFTLPADGYEEAEPEPTDLYTFADDIISLGSRVGSAGSPVIPQIKPQMARTEKTKRRLMRNVRLGL